MVQTTPSQQQLKFLDELSSLETELREEEALAKCPEWTVLEKKKSIPKNHANELAQLHTKEMPEKILALRQNRQFTLDLVTFLEKYTSADHHIKYILTLYHEAIRTDTSLLEEMLNFLKDIAVYDIFVKFMLKSKEKSESYANEKACFILTSLIARARSGWVPDGKVEDLIELLVQGKLHLNVASTLDSLKNLLKLSPARKMVWNNEKARKLIFDNLAVDQTLTAYLAVFCGWLITFDSAILPTFIESELITICDILHGSKVDKVVRQCINIIVNCLIDDSAIEIFIQQNVLHTLQLLEYEKWRDEELYKEIRTGITSLQLKIKLFSNFDRYLRELDTGKLSWSYLHSEKFWHENVMQFENDEFSAVKKLSQLLSSNDPTTLAVACFDLGEFTRLYPTGKKIIQKFSIKEKVLALMSRKERNVSREALACTQKIMLDNWKNVAVTS